ncbi:MAG: fimbrial assembly protein [Oxalobacteraceae bacterium]|nr:fimbrial assembly protein [Oxalobacteraceae bacterium]
MIRLNLLPWREERRRERKQQFQRQLGLMAVLGLSVVLAVFAINTRCIGLQEERNQLLSTENAKLDVHLREIQQLQQQIAALNARRSAVERLQSGRTYPVRLLDELANRVPQGVASNARVSELLRALNTDAAWMGQPELGEIKSANLGQGRDARKIVEFSISLEQRTTEKGLK